MSDDVRTSILAAAVRRASEEGLSRLSLEDIAAAAGVSRATLYRVFPGGRAQLMADAADWEVQRFWRRLAEAVAVHPDLESRLVEGLALGTELIHRSPVVANLLAPDLDELVDAMLPTRDVVMEGLVGYFEGLLRREPRLAPGVVVPVAAEYLARMVLSYFGSAGGHDLTDRGETLRLVRTQFLGGILTPAEPT